VATAADSPVVGAGDGQHLWMLQPHPSDPTITVLHRHHNDEPNELTKVTSLNGRVGQHAVAAVDGRLWLAYTGTRTLQSITATRNQSTGLWGFAKTNQPPLPPAAVLRGLTAGDVGPWILMCIEIPDSPGTANPDDTQSDTPTRSSIQPGEELDVVLKLPPGTHSDTAAAAKTKQSTATPKPQSATMPLPHDRLLALQQGKWRPVELPQDWPHNEPAWLVMLHPGDLVPVLIARSPAPAQDELWIYRRKQDAWDKQTHSLGRQAAIGTVAIDNQLILAQRPVDGRDIRINLTLLRSQSSAALGRLSLALSPDTPYALAAVDTSIALIAKQPDQPAADDAKKKKYTPTYTWTAMNLLGKVTHPPARLAVAERAPLAQAARYLLIISVMVMATLMMLVFWRRDPRANLVHLPPTLILGDFARRAAAGLIDLLPAVLPTLILFDIGPMQLWQRWPGAQGPDADLQNILPGIMVIAIFLTHCTITETFTARTVGKAITGLRVVTLTGQRPTAGQLLSRNVLKTLDLIAWLLLLLPLIGPYRQRLGDMVARTVVVMDAPVGDQDSPDDTNDTDDTDDRDEP
jgi:uncharacterized RDD family membrane protein YckC